MSQTLMQVIEPELNPDYSDPNTDQVVGRFVELAQIEPDPDNPRKHFDPAKLEELAQDIAAHGIVEPLVVRPDGDRYTIVCGERRWRAAGRAGLDRVPCVVRDDLDDKSALAIMIAENIQRADLTPLEEARGYARLQELGMKQGEIAEQFGLAQPTIANSVKLLKLPEAVQQMIEGGALSKAQGQALGRFSDWPEACAIIANEAKERGYSSKAIETSVLSSYELERRKLAKSLGWQTEFDVAAACHHCPNYRKDGNSGVCFYPKCYEAKQKEAAQTKEARAEQQVADLHAAAAQGKTLSIKDLSSDQYRRLPVPGCKGESCEHHAQAKDYQGDLVAICLKPACREKLEKAAEKAKQDDKRKRVESVAEKALPALDSPEKCLAVLLEAVLADCTAPVVNQALGDMGTGVPGVLFTDTGWGAGATKAERLRMLEALATAYGVGAVLSDGCPRPRTQGAGERGR